MTEPASIEEENSSPPLPEITLGIDIGRSPCCVSVWNGSRVEIWKESINEMIKRYFETFDHVFTDGASSSNVSLSQAHEDAVSNLKDLISALFNESANFPFLMHTLDIKIRPFVAAFVNKVCKSTTAVELLGNFLVNLKEMAETELKQPIRNVVFIIPVSFSRLQQTRIRIACEMAGLKVIRLMPEPTAVALLYAHQQLHASASSHEDMDNESKKIALIFNMDAGYCDVAIIATEKGKRQIKALAGSAIGGEDLLGNMMCHLFPDYENIFKRNVHRDTEITRMASLRSIVHNAITKLSSEASVKVYLTSLNRRDVTREEFEEVNKEVFENCEKLIIQCIQDAKIEVENINDVIIVGGCCNIPRVESLVTKICKGKKPYKLGVNPLDDVLRGATVAGAVNDPSGDLDLLTSQVTLLAIGIRADGNKFVPIIPRNTPVPTMNSDILLTTIHDNQTAALIVVYEGEGQKVEENQLLGYFKLTEIPKAPKGFPKIIVSMDIDDKSALRVTAFLEMPPISVEVRNYDAGRIGYCDESLIRKHGDRMDLVTLDLEE
ncbi:putative Heat shock protein 70 family [Medicago truncatula]|uniref:Heat shock 70 kDa protein n=2 Tax=Medicago truncatula TaxID=3880 RepID=G7JPY2_MEDTR|nr:heat shock 70 kDa protein [Medicago truncatula]RHN63616.1 putative Heat shock protein 70 family [Medicago truncatula]